MMSQNEALQNLINAVQVAYDKHAYTMQEAALLWESINVFITQPENENQKQSSKKPTKQNK